jgi:hypothetical protein
MSIEKFNDLIGNRTRDLPACRIVLQPITLPCASIYGYVKCNILYKGYGLRFIICACYWWDMELTMTSAYHSIACRTGIESVIMFFVSGTACPVPIICMIWLFYAKPLEEIQQWWSFIYLLVIVE